MNKSQAKKKVFDYFKKNAIEYKFVNCKLYTKCIGNK